MGGGSSARGELKKDIVGDLKKTVGLQTDYRGVEYSEAELRKLPKAEQEYRRQLMQMSKQEVKMEMGFESVLKGGLDTFQHYYGKFKKEEGASNFDFTKKLPASGVLKFRFKEKALNKSGKATPAAPAEAKPAAWAASRSAAMSRRQGAGTAAIEKEESFMGKIKRITSVSYVLKSLVMMAIQILQTVFGILVSLKDTLTGGGTPRTAEQLRKARASAT